LVNVHFSLSSVTVLHTDTLSLLFFRWRWCNYLKFVRENRVEPISVVLHDAVLVFEDSLSFVAICKVPLVGKYGPVANKGDHCWGWKGFRAYGIPSETKSKKPSKCSNPNESLPRNCHLLSNHHPSHSLLSQNHVVKLNGTHILLHFLLQLALFLYHRGGDVVAHI